MVDDPRHQPRVQAPRTWPRTTSLPTVFLALALVLGTALAIVTPPLRWADENTHLLQSYALSEGHVRPEIRDGVLGVDVPRAVVRFILVNAAWYMKREPGVPSRSDVWETRQIRTTDERAFAPLAVFTYSVIGYLPQAAGIALARTCTDSVLLQLYAARIANLLCWALLVWLALRTTPYLKLPLCVLALAPMTVFLAGTCAADGVTNGLAFCWTAHVVRIASDDHRPASLVGTWLPTALLAVALALTKLLYAPLILLLLLIPPARLGGAKRLIGISGAVLVLGLLAVAIFVTLSWDQLLKTINYRGDTAAAANLALLREHPATVLGMVWSTTYETATSWLWQLADVNWKGIAAPRWLFWVWLAALTVAFVGEARPDRWPTRRQRIVAATAPLLAWIAISLGAFLFWTKGQRAIAGLQGRYLIPLIPALLIAIAPPTVPILARRSRVSTGVALALCIWALLHTIQRTTLLY
jgi:uncharacterized membrane protein